MTCNDSYSYYRVKYNFFYKIAKTFDKCFEHVCFQVIDIDIDLVANHKGFFAFNLCPQNNPIKTVEASCFEQYPLKMKNGDKYFYITTSLPDRQSFQIQLPHGLECWHCIIQWTYVAGELNKQYSTT